MAVVQVVLVARRDKEPVAAEVAVLTGAWNPFQLFPGKPIAFL